MVIREEFVKCGKKNCTKCPHGPYRYEYWKEKGKLRKKYLGKGTSLKRENKVEQSEPKLDKAKIKQSQAIETPVLNLIRKLEKAKSGWYDGREYVINTEDFMKITKRDFDEVVKLVRQNYELRFAMGVGSKTVPSTKAFLYIKAPSDYVEPEMDENLKALMDLGKGNKFLQESESKEKGESQHRELSESEFLNLVERAYFEVDIDQKLGDMITIPVLTEKLQENLKWDEQKIHEMLYDLYVDHKIDLQPGKVKEGSFPMKMEGHKYYWFKFREIKPELDENLEALMELGKGNKFLESEEPDMFSGKYNIQKEKEFAGKMYRLRSVSPNLKQAKKNQQNYEKDGYDTQLVEEGPMGSGYHLYAKER